MDFFEARHQFEVTCQATGIPDDDGRCRPLAARTVASHLYWVDRFQRKFPFVLGTWTKHHVRAFLANRKFKSNNTKRSVWKALRIFDRFLRQEGITLESFIEGVPCPPHGRPEPAPTYTDEDFALFLRCCTHWTWIGIRDRAILWTLRRTGFRKSEYAAMRVSDVYFAEGVIAVPTSKGGTGYATTLFPETREAIAEYLAKRPYKDATALWVNDDGTPMTAGGLTLMLKRIHARAKAGGFQKRLYFHAFRHNYGRDTVRWGLSTTETMKALGQRSIRAAVIYTQEVADEEGQRKLRRIAGLSA